VDARTSPRAWYAAVSDAAVDVVALVPDDAWSSPGLGEWTIRELVAHLSRAWSTIGDYLAEPEPAEGTPVLTAARYLTVGLTLPGVHEGVAQRARADVAALGDAPAAVLRDLARSATGLVAVTADDRLVDTRFGALRFDEYLRTRAFELTVHGLDLTRALGLATPQALADAAVPTLALLAETAAERSSSVVLLESLAGRRALPDGYTLLS
jgi:uncharacterized protein (TIGR03083 family)